MAFRPDPKAEAIDAFSLSWTELDFYAFPPFICISRVLQKITSDRATGILIVPDWPNKTWYNVYLDMVIRETILFSRENLLYLPSEPSLVHPLHKNLK